MVRFGVMRSQFRKVHTQLKKYDVAVGISHDNPYLFARAHGYA